VTVRESRLVAHLPNALSFEEGAAVIDGAYQGLFALRRGRVAKGTRLLVYGASGSCGTACVQLGRQLGAHVTAVCGTKNVELVRSLGADVVVDYQREDFRKRDEKYDVIVDAVGKIVGLRYRGSLVPGGMFVLTDGLWNVLSVLLTRWSDRRIVAAWPRYEKEDLLFLKRLLETGEYRAVIDRTYPLEDVAEAHRYVDTWQKTGNVVLTLDGGEGVDA
jgi:NADPH2:quinone reductase